MNRKRKQASKVLPVKCPPRLSRIRQPFGRDAILAVLLHTLVSGGCDLRKFDEKLKLFQLLIGNVYMERRGKDLCSGGDLTEWSGHSCGGYRSISGFGYRMKKGMNSSLDMNTPFSIKTIRRSLNQAGRTSLLGRRVRISTPYPLVR